MKVVHAQSDGALPSGKRVRRKTADTLSDGCRAAAAVRNPCLPKRCIRTGKGTGKGGSRTHPPVDAWGVALGAPHASQGGGKERSDYLTK